MKLLLWIIFIALLAVMGYQSHVLCASGYDIVSLELADNARGMVIVGKWQLLYYGDITFIELARQNTQWDFFFIASYAALMLTLCNWQMQREKWLPLNELLRFNFLIVVAAAVLDVIENFRLLHNFHHVNDVASYWGTHWLASIKFILLALALMIFLGSYVKSFIKK